MLAAQDFAAKNEPDSVRMMLNVIQTDTTMDVTEKQNFVSYMNTIADLLDSNQTIYTANTAQIANIQVVATTNTKAGAHANAGLKARKLPNHNYKIEDIPGNNLRLINNEEQPENHEKIQLANTDAFILYPNPNSGAFNIKIGHLEDNNVPITITITNLLGEELLQKTVNVLTDSPIEIKDKTFAKGVYLVIITQNNLPIGQSKIIIE